jgi:hypothetical protein
MLFNQFYLSFKNIFNIIICNIVRKLRKINFFLSWVHHSPNFFQMMRFNGFFKSSELFCNFKEILSVILDECFRESIQSWRKFYFIIFFFKKNIFMFFYKLIKLIFFFLYLIFLIIFVRLLFKDILFLSRFSYLLTLSIFRLWFQFYLLLFIQVVRLLLLLLPLFKEKKNNT